MNRRSLLRVAVKLILSACVCVGTAWGQTTLVPAGATWKYLDNGSNQGTAWRATGFDDSGWASGPAQLGYGDGDEATVVSFGPNASNKYVTTYFRRSFTLADPSQFQSLTLRLLRDDGAVVYLNGTELHRDNMPTGTISFNTFAVNTIGGADESTFYQSTHGTQLLQAGTNVVAVEVHQVNLTSSDLSFDLSLTASASPSSIQLRRGPYLQMMTPTSVYIVWRTDIASNSVVRYGTSPAALDQTVSDPAAVIDHRVRLTNLAPATKYYYRIESNNVALTPAHADYHFVTHPVAGTVKPTRIWVLGDSGTANANARAVRDAMINEIAASGKDIDFWLMLGDNAYPDGTDSQYQAAVFDMYPTFLRNRCLWSTLGNHDGHTADSASQTGPYYDIHIFPRQGEAGGLASGTEAYYSFDYANIHFIVLDSYETPRGVNDPMLQWAMADANATTQEWIIAFWHHPPYSKGSHNSDIGTELIQMRQNALPILEAAGVDLVLTGHSHSYERSYLINGNYSTPTTYFGVLDNGSGREDDSGPYRKPAGLTANAGTVHVVAGSSGQISGGALNHVLMYRSLNELGSLVIDVDGPRLDAFFLNNNGARRDWFTILKGAVTPTSTPTNTPSMTPTATATPSSTPTATPIPIKLEAVIGAGDPCRSQTFTVDLLVSANTYDTIGSYALLFNYDPAVVTFVSASDGGAFGAPPSTGGQAGAQFVSSFNPGSALLNGLLLRAVFQPANPGRTGLITLSITPHGPTPLVSTSFATLPVIIEHAAVANLCAPVRHTRCACRVLPTAGDADGDGVPDAAEFDPANGSPPAGTNRFLWDSDGDGLADGYEDANGNGARDSGELDPRRRDSDGDGAWDGIELFELNSDPLNALSPGGVVDFDQDGLPAASDFDDHQRDYDRDGFADGFERMSCGFVAVIDAMKKPPLGDANCDSAVTNVDALIAQSIQLGLTQHGFFAGESNLDVNRDAFVTNVDALIVQSRFLGLTPFVPVPAF